METRVEMKREREGIEFMLFTTRIKIYTQTYIYYIYIYRQT